MPKVSNIMKKPFAEDLHNDFNRKVTQNIESKAQNKIVVE